MQQPKLVRDKYTIAIEDADAMALLNKRDVVILHDLTVKLANDLQPSDGRVLEKVRYTLSTEALRGWCDKPRSSVWGTADEN